MKRLIALPLLLSATTSAAFLLAAPSFAQTVPIIGGNLNTVNTGGFFVKFPTSLTSSTLLTPLGIVTVNSNGFNGSLANTFTLPIIGTNTVSSTVTSSAISDSNPFGSGIFVVGAFAVTNSLVFTGTTNGTSPNGAFINAPTTINARIRIPGISLPSPSTYAANVTGGSITLPAPVVPAPVVPAPITCTSCLIPPPNLPIANLSLAYSNLQIPEYRQENKDDFSTSHFRGSRVLSLDDK
jgi:hypothetical protein